MTVSVQTSVQLNSCGPILSAHTLTHCQLLAAQYLASTHNTQVCQNSLFGGAGMHFLMQLIVN